MTKSMTKKEKQILFWRILIGFLIVSNMAVIFMFSAQSSAQSAALSKKITDAIVQILPKDYVEKLLNKTVTSTTQKPNTEKPKETTPEETTSEETTPEETTPEETTPEETTSDETTPEETTPEETTPEETTPEETTSEETTSEEIQPEETTPPKEQKPQKPKDSLTKEQQTLAKKSHTPIRKIAHMLEFGSLATLSLLFLITWQGKLWWRYLAALGFTLFYAGTDEFHQIFIDGRGPQLSDVFVDFTGALIACTIALVIIIIVRRIQTPKNERLTLTQELSALWSEISKTFSGVCAFVSKQVSKIKAIHPKKEKEN